MCPPIPVRGGGVGERCGQDGNEPTGELAPPDTVEQTGAGRVDSRVNEGGGDVLGQVLEVIAGVGSDPGVVVQVVDLVYQDQLRAEVGQQVTGLSGQFDLRGAGQVRGAPRNFRISMLSDFGVACGGIVR